MNGFFAENWTNLMNDPANHPVLWAAVAAILMFAALFIIEKLSEQPFFGGGKHRPPLEEHYLHGEITTAEFETLKSHQ